MHEVIQLCVYARARGDAISRAYEGDMRHSIFQNNMPHDEDYHCEPIQEEEASTLAIRAALVLPPDSLMTVGM